LALTTAITLALGSAQRRSSRTLWAMAPKSTSAQINGESFIALLAFIAFKQIT
jgi:hypothetical protein